MDQDPMVSEQTESGKHRIEALAVAGFDVRIAFWAKPSDDGKWFLYLASPAVVEKGPLAAYRFVFDGLRQIPDLPIEPLEIKVIGLNDSLAQAALAITKPMVTDTPFTVRNPKPHSGTTCSGGPVLGGLSVEGAYIYPPAQAAA
jgi:hypothetical protein